MAKNLIDINGNSVEDFLCAEESSHGLMSSDDKVKLNSIEEGANKNVQADLSQTDPTADNYVKNKPTNESVLEMFMEMDVVQPMADTDGKVLTDTDGKVFII